MRLCPARLCSNGTYAHYHLQKYSKKTKLHWFLPYYFHRERIYLYNVQAFVLPVRIVVLCSQDMENGKNSKKEKNE